MKRCVRYGLNMQRCCDLDARRHARFSGGLLPGHRAVKSSCFPSPKNGASLPARQARGKISLRRKHARNHNQQRPAVSGALFGPGGDGRITEINGFR